MTREALISLSAAVLSLALVPNMAYAGPTNNALDTHNTNSSAVQNDAEQMVPAQAVLKKTLDARKLQSGQQFEATLDGKVKLKDGQELPGGTVLYGRVSQDRTSNSGNSTLALSFTQARLKDGKTIPIEATIIGVLPAGSPNYEGENLWTPQTLRIDQQSVVRDVDLHSRIDGQNSGVFVSSKEHDVKLSQGSEFSLAIAARQKLAHGA